LAQQSSPLHGQRPARLLLVGSRHHLLHPESPILVRLRPRTPQSPRPHPRRRPSARRLLRITQFFPALLPAIQFDRCAYPSGYAKLFFPAVLLRSPKYTRSDVLVGSLRTRERLIL